MKYVFPELLVGWQKETTQTKAIGFHTQQIQAKTKKRQTLITHNGEQHLLTIAPTGAGKGVSGVIPALLTYQGPTITVDIKGENYKVAAERRREMGHQVVAIDPFQLLVQNGDTLNPLDLLQLSNSELQDCDLEMIVELLTGHVPMSTKDVFWELSGKGMLTGLTGYTAQHADSNKRNLATLLDHIYADDVDYNLAVALDQRAVHSRLAYQEIACYLSHESERCRPSVRSTAQAFVKCLNSDAVRKSLSCTSFDLKGIVRGDPIDIFIIFPPEKLESHRILLRLWLGTLFNVLLRRKHQPTLSTLLLLDEAAQFGYLPQLKTALTLGRGFGVRCWTFWQDLGQLQQNYPNDWPTIINNSGVLQVFGMTNGWMAKGCAELLGLELHELLKMNKTDQALMMPSQDAQVVRRVDYLKDRMFRGIYQENPRYHHDPDEPDIHGGLKIGG